MNIACFRIYMLLQNLPKLWQDRSITKSVVPGGFTKIYAYVNLRKALAPPISMANMSSEQCGKREPILRMWGELLVRGNEWFCAFCDFLCVKDLWNTIFLCNLKLRCIIMWSDLWLRVVSGRTHSFFGSVGWKQASWFLIMVLSE